MVADRGTTVSKKTKPRLVTEQSQNLHRQLTIVERYKARTEPIVDALKSYLQQASHVAERIPCGEHMRVVRSRDGPFLNAEHISLTFRIVRSGQPSQVVTALCHRRDHEHKKHIPLPKDQAYCLECEGLHPRFSQLLLTNPVQREHTARACK